MNAPHVLHIVAIFAAFFAVFVYGMVALKFLETPVSFLWFGAGLIFNALQRISTYLLDHWDWVWFFDAMLLPTCEAVCYAFGSTLLLSHHRRVIRTFNERVREHFDDDSTCIPE